MKRFDRAFFGHIGHILRTSIRVVLLTMTRGGLSRYYGSFLSPYKRRLVWVSSIFALISDISAADIWGRIESQAENNVVWGMYCRDVFTTCTMVYL